MKLAPDLVGNSEPLHRVLREVRSEEHTSELQSHLNLVCRLLLEKKKKNEREILQVARDPGELARAISHTDRRIAVYSQHTMSERPVTHPYPQRSAATAPHVTQSR